MNRDALSTLPFCEAAPAWLDSRRPYLSANTFHDYTTYIRTLSRTFGEMTLCEIGADEIRAYQRMRLLRAGASAINHETCVMQQMLKRAGRWAQLADNYQPLPLPRESVGRCITDQEEARFFRFALSKPEWCVAAWISLISVNTTAGPGEILHLRLCDVDLTDKLTMRINAAGAKNNFRIRLIPLNDTALWAAKLFYARAQSLRATLPEHCLIPFLIKRGCYDPTHPQKTYYKAFNEILSAANLHFRPYDFRHTSITRMLERGVPEETVLAMAGHVSRQMLRRYSHIRLEAKRSAVEVLQRKPPQAVVAMLQAEHPIVEGQLCLNR